jgi:hypothetical protein
MRITTTVSAREGNPYFYASKIPPEILAQKPKISEEERK